MQRMRRGRVRGKRSRSRSQSKSWLLLAVVGLALFGCTYGRVSEQVVYAMDGRPAVWFRELHHRWSRVALLDIDLTCPGVRVEVAAAGTPPRRSGCSFGVARTVTDWCRATGAVAGIN